MFGWRTGGAASQVDLQGAGIARHLHDLLAGGAATMIESTSSTRRGCGDSRRDRVELALHRLRALALPRHDEGAADIAVLMKPLAVLHAQHVGDLQRGVAAGVGDRVTTSMSWPDARAGSSRRGSRPCACGALCTEISSDHRVRAREIHVLEDAAGVPVGAHCCANSSPRAR